MGRVYHQSIHIPQQIVRNIEDLMHTKGELSSCEAISYTARFDNGVEMVIDLNGADDDYPSAVAILFRDDWAIRRTDEAFAIPLNNYRNDCDEYDMHIVPVYVETFFRKCPNLGDINSTVYVEMEEE